jgi:ABC-2 type transport system permease protein
MSLPRGRRLLGTYKGLLRVGFAEAVAYRSEFIVWFLATNMPLVMWLLWSTVAEEGPIGGYGPAQFAAYFIVTLIVRLLSGAWVVWQMTEEIRSGTMGQRLLRPLHPFLNYSAENLAAFPIRLMMLAPIFVFAGLYIGRDGFTHAVAQWPLAIVAIMSAWALGFAAQLLIGSLAMHWQSAVSLMDFWLGMYFVFSGYLMPLDLFPAGLREVIVWLPFPYMVSLPVQTILGQIDTAATLRGISVQWAYIGGFMLTSSLVFRAGLRRYQVFGG